MSSLTCTGLHCKRQNWPTGATCVRDVTMEFKPGLVHGIFGENGSGKGLLLYLLGLLDRPDSGIVSVLGKNLNQLDPAALTWQKNSLFGYLFRQPCLLPSFSVAENIAIPLLRIRGVSAEEASNRTRSMLEFVGLPDLGDFPACQLDHATQQQIAFVRALIHHPKILIAVSPFPTLLPLTRLAAHEMGITVVCSGKESFLAAVCDRLFIMKKGVLSERKSIAEFL